MENIVEIKGTVAWYNTARGFGVIRGEDHKEYFIHYTNLIHLSSNLIQGQRVAFKTGPRKHKKGGMEAYGVRILQSEVDKPKSPLPRISSTADTSHWYTGLKTGISPKPNQVQALAG